MSGVEVFGEKVAAGERKSFRAKVGELNDGTTVTVPVMVVAGRGDGPVVLLSGAVHGDEFIGPATIPRLLHDLDPAKVQGAVIGIPIMSPYAYFGRSRSNNLDYEHLNLNRIWPGDTAGFVSQQMAHRIFEGAVRKATHVVDFHEGGVAFMAEYIIVGGNDSSRADLVETQLAMAKWFGNGLPIAQYTVTEQAARLGRLSTLSAACGGAGIPALTIEVGGGGTIYDRHVNMVMAGIPRILSGLGVTPGGSTSDGKKQFIVYENMWPRPKHGGLLRPEPGMDCGVTVEKGQKLAIVTDVFGEVVDELTAPYDAVILDTRVLSSLYPGDWTFHLGKLSG